ncbi:MAG: D-alanyl-D-alanine carboxypeptidase/D-alanyl-D-alanine-endopeptidase [Frankia sp.]|nr:D-alanyl-D-alanine carboxypeptidase/D-alanyl-D-alanine-endopeptidase [Frankia sp.]
MAAGAKAGGLTALAGALLAGSLSVPPGPSPGAVPATTVPRAAQGALPALSADSPLPDPTALANQLAPALADPVLADPSGIVMDATSGRVLFERRSTVPTAPASTLKTAVAAAALRTFPADRRLTTRVLYLPGTGTADGSAPSPAAGGTLWLVGAGDPTLTAATEPVGYPASASARLADLAAQVSAAGITSVERVLGDGTLFTGPATAPGWRDSYVTGGNVAPVSALEVDGGRSRPGALGPRHQQPDAAAAAAFADALRAAGVGVGSVGVGPADRAAETVATADSPPIPVLVERMLTDSDNDLAEALGRLVAVERGQPATFAGAVAAVTQALRELGINTDGMALSDLSGLSTLDLITPRTIIEILRAATQPDHPQLRPLLTGLPVAGFSGTLFDRYDDADTAVGAGDVRAKTGSLRIVTSLAGQLVDADDRLLLFAFFAPVEDTASAKAGLDRIASALATCGCRSPASPGPEDKADAGVTVGAGAGAAGPPPPA